MGTQLLSLENKALAILQKQGYAIATHEIRKAITNALGIPGSRFNPKTGIMEPTKAFDMVEAPADVDLECEFSIRKNFNRINLVEVKGKKNTKKGFNLHITENEVALSYFLGKKLKLAIVDTGSGEVIWDTIHDAMKRGEGRINSIFYFWYRAK